MVGLGDLPGSDFISSGFGGVSADGSTVVGQSHSTFAPGGEASRWTQADGMVGLGVAGIAWDSSADGSVIVGHSDSGKAWIWDDTNGVRFIFDVLEADGLDLTGWTLKRATGISDDGLVVVGEGINPDGNEEAWIADLSFIPEPTTCALALAALCLAMSRRRAF